MTDTITRWRLNYVPEGTDAEVETQIRYVSGARVLCCGTRAEKAYLWLQATENGYTGLRTFRCVRTGESVQPEWIYIGSCLAVDGCWDVHVYEIDILQWAPVEAPLSTTAGSAEVTHTITGNQFTTGSSGSGWGMPMETKPAPLLSPVP